MNTQRVEIERMSNSGDGVGYLEAGKIVFVPRTLPGEVVEVELVDEKKTWARGEVAQIVEPAEERQPSDCPYFDRCGGCQFWHTDYATELGLKTDAAFEAMRRISKVELPQPDVVGAPDERRYRSRVTFHRRRTGPEGEGPWAIGFFERRSDDIVEVDDCPITEPLLNQVRRALEPALHDVGEVDIVLETAGAGEVVVTLETDERVHKLPRSLADFARTLDGNPTVRGIRFDTADELIVLGDTTVDADQVLARPPVGAVRLPGGGFRQSYRQMNDRLVGLVGEAVEAAEATSALELYCGAGNFSFALADLVSGVVGLEGSEPAVEAASAMAKLAGLEHVYFGQWDLGDGFLDGLSGDPNAFDLVLLDPPRAGARAACEELVELSGLQTVVYVSCDPACLGRDLKALDAGGWKVDRLTMVDMFPRTAHVETVAVLTRK